MNMHNPVEPPANIEAEQAVLGAIMIRNDAYDTVSSTGLKPEHFSEGLHSRIFEACGDLIDADKSANPLSVKSFLPSDVMVGQQSISQYLASLTTAAFTISRIDEQADTVIQAAKCRSLMGATQHAYESSSRFLTDIELAEAIDALSDRLDMIREDGARRDGGYSAGASYLAMFDKAAKSDDVAGVPIGIRELSKVLSEPTFEEGNLYGLLSSSGEGKTSLTIQLIMSALKQGHPCLFLSYDQSPAQIVRQWIAQEHGIEVRRQRQPAKWLNEQEQTQCVQFAQWIDKQPLQIIKCNREGIKPLLAYIRSFAKRHKINPKTPFVVIDHIGKITPRDPKLSPDRISGEVTVELKSSANQNKAAVLVLNQRNTFGTRRDNPRPIGADLYGGEGARADYDAVAYLYRQEKYKAERAKIATTDADWEKINQAFGSEVEGLAELGSIKVRFGDPNITEMLNFEAKFTRYVSPPSANHDDPRMI